MWVHILLGTRISAWGRFFNRYPNCEKASSLYLSFSRNKDLGKNKNKQVNTEKNSSHPLFCSWHSMCCKGGNFSIDLLHGWKVNCASPKYGNEWLVISFYPISFLKMLVLLVNNYVSSRKDASQTDQSQVPCSWHCTYFHSRQFWDFHSISLVI